MKHLRPALALIATLTACSGEGAPNESRAAASAPLAMKEAYSTPGAPSDQAGGVANQRDVGKNIPGDASAARLQPATVLIRTGQATIEVRRLDEGISKVRQIATQAGGYITNSSLSAGNEQVKSATLEVKIPADKYEQAVAALSSVGNVESVNTNVDDVGEEFVDVTARVANLKKLEERLVALLANRTGKLEEVLAVERELARVRTEIETYEGRLRYIRSRAALSTLSVTIHEPAPVLSEFGGRNPILSAFREAWRNFVRFVASFIASLGIILPLGAIVALAYWVWRKYFRGRFPGRGGKAG